MILSYKWKVSFRIIPPNSRIVGWYIRIRLNFSNGINIFFLNYLEQADDIRHSPQGKESYKLHSQTIERVFADAKEKYGMRYTTYRGLERVGMWVRFKFIAMNLKKLAIWKWKNNHSPLRKHKNSIIPKKPPIFSLLNRGSLTVRGRCQFWHLPFLLIEEIVDWVHLGEKALWIYG